MEVLAKKMTYRTFREMEFDDNDNFLYELLNGELVKKSAPSVSHQRMVVDLVFKIKLFIQETNAGEVLCAPVDVYLDDENVPQPDIVFVSEKRLKIIDENEGIVMGAPDLVVEIISPSSLKRDRFDKKELYERFGVKEYWLVDPNNTTIEVHKNRKNGGFKLFSFAAVKGKIKSSVLKEFQLDVADFFKK